MRQFLSLAGLLGCALLAAAGADASALRVSPTSVSLVAPDAAAALALTNDSDRSVNVQIRVFRWTQPDGVEELAPTREVVASPPAVRLPPGGKTAVRLVRVARTPVVGEESYRIVIDEIPDPAQRRNGSVAFVMRYSLPAFFVSPSAAPAALEWSMGGDRGPAELVGVNRGERHVRLSDLSVTDGLGRTISLGEGLVGYVLGGSKRLWSIRGRGLSGGSVAVSAMSEAGRIDAVTSGR